MLHDIACVQQLLPEDRGLLAFSNASLIRNPAERGDGAVTLKKGAAGYSLVEDIYVRGPLFSPTTVRQWVMFDADVKTPKNAMGEAVTSVGWRLNNGTSDYWWDGAAWTAPDAREWNTLVEIQAHVATFSVTARKIRFVANLMTTDATLTPELLEARFFARIESSSGLGDVIYDDLLAWVKTVAPESDMVRAWPAVGTTVNIGTLLSTEKEPLDVVDVYGAFNYDTDPNLTTNLKSSYNTGTKVLTLTGSVAAGVRVWLRVVIRPTVAMATNADFDEVARIPAILVRDVSQTLRADPTGHVLFVRRDTGAGWKVPTPRQVDISFKLVGIAPRLEEAASIVEALQRLTRGVRRLHLASLDVDVDLVIEDDAVIVPGLTEKHLHEAAVALRLVAVPIWLRPATAIKAITQVNVAPPAGQAGVTLTVL